MREKQIAQDVEVCQESGELAGRLFIIATARQGHNLAELEAAIGEGLQSIQSQPPTAEEISRAVHRFEANVIRSLESAGGFDGRADRLNRYNVFTGNPGYLADDFRRHLAVTSEGVERVASTYLGPGRVVLEVTPGQTTKIAPDPRIAAEHARAALAKTVRESPLPPVSLPPEGHDRQTLPAPARSPRVAFPSSQRARLSNGMEVLVVEKHALPAVTVNLIMRTGRSSDTAATLGLARVMAGVWADGTPERSGEEIADQLADIGASLSITADWDATTARLFCLKRHLPEALAIYADVLRNPAFPETELALEKSIALGRMVQVRDDAKALAQWVTAAMLFGPAHPYGQPPYGTPATIGVIGRQDLLRFFQTQRSPRACHAGRGGRRSAGRSGGGAGTGFCRLDGDGRRARGRDADSAAGPAHADCAGG